MKIKKLYYGKYLSLMDIIIHIRFHFYDIMFKALYGWYNIKNTIKPTYNFFDTKFYTFNINFVFRSCFNHKCMYPLKYT